MAVTAEVLFATKGAAENKVSIKIDYCSYCIFDRELIEVPDASWPELALYHYVGLARFYSG
jgi:hypothetical protein